MSVILRDTATLEELDHMASAPPPPGYGYWAIRFQTVGSPHISEITCGFKVNSLDTAIQSNIRLRNAMAATGSPFLAPVMGSSFTILNTYVLSNLSGLLTADTDIAPIAGSLSIQNPSLNTALVIKKNTLYAGRQYRGRMMVPPMKLAETDVSVAGIISGSSLTSNQGNWNTFYTALNSQLISPYLLHNPPLVGSTPPPTNIISFQVTPLIGTIKRRIRP